MTRGLIIGKFMPIHKGHMALIDFGLKHCDKLIIAVCTLDDEPIDGRLRYNWVKEIYENNNKVKVIWIRERLHEKDLDFKEATKLWGKYLLDNLPKIDIIFSSEEYGNYLSAYMGAHHKVFDIDRKNKNISATMIRENPLKYLDYIPRVVRPYFIED